VIYKVWLIYAYHREGGEIAASSRRFTVWGKRDLKTAEKLKKRINRQGIRYDRITTDNWDSFLLAFEEDILDHRKEYAVRLVREVCGSFPPPFKLRITGTRFSAS
jgi:IS1 family transposase